MSATVRASGAWLAAAISLAVLGTTVGAASCFATLAIASADDRSSDRAPGEPEDEREGDDSSLEDDSFEEDSFEENAVLCRDDRARHAAGAIALVLIGHAQACGRSAAGRLERPPRI